MEHTIPLLIEKDKVFSLILEQYGIPGFVSRPQGFESLCKTILEQQVSLDSAKASFDKLKNLVKDFAPEKILEVTDVEFRSCGVSRQKTSYLRALAEAVIDKLVDFDSLRINTLNR